MQDKVPMQIAMDNTLKFNPLAFPLPISGLN
jgi:hypothetical protein